MFDVVMSTHPGEKITKKEKNLNLWNPVMNHSVKCMN